MDKQIAIIVVTHNRINLLEEVIASLRIQTYTDVQIVVVNNGSTDGTQEWLDAQKDIITVTQQNLGGAGGFHTGMKYAAENGYEFCWIMDDDVICEPTALEELVKGMSMKAGIGFVCSNVLGIDGKPMNVPTVDTTLQQNGYPDFMDLIDNGMIRVSTATFVSVLIPSSVIYEIGLPYKEYFIWGDDTEYTERVSAVHPCYVAGRSKVIHKRSIQKGLDFSEETDSQRLQMYFYKIRNIGHRLHKKGLSRRQFYYDNLKLAIRFLLKRKITQVKIIVKALASTIYFLPQVEFPNVPSQAL